MHRTVGSSGVHLWITDHIKGTFFFKLSVCFGEKIRENLSVPLFSDWNNVLLRDKMNISRPQKNIHFGSHENQIFEKTAR